MAEQKTRQTSDDPHALLEAIGDERKREDAKRLMQVMSDATGEPPVMWGPTMIGFGSFHYKYASGHEGDTMRVGFAPRKTALTLYGLQGHSRSEELLGALGTHTLGKGCVYVKRLDDVDLDVLRQLVAHAYAEADSPTQDD